MKNISPESRIASECLAGRVRILNRIVTSIYEDALRPYKVRISQMNVLVAIAAMGQVRATDVCRTLQLEKSTLSRDLARLLDRGWVVATPGAGRTQTLEATDAGRALIKKTVTAWEVAQRRVVEVLGPAFTKGIYDAANRLRAAEGEHV